MKLYYKKYIKPYVLSEIRKKGRKKRVLDGSKNRRQGVCPQKTEKNLKNTCF